MYLFIGIFLLLVVIAIVLYATGVLKIGTTEESSPESRNVQYDVSKSSTETGSSTEFSSFS